VPESLLFWISRSSPDNLRTCREIVRLGHRVATVPVLEIAPLRQRAPWRPPTGLIFTSGHGVRHHRAGPGWEDLPVYAVGDATAALASSSGYREVRSAAGDAGDLERLILSCTGPSDHLVHLAAREPAVDLVSTLRAAGIGAETLAVYESVAASPGRIRAVSDTLGRIDAIVVHSRKGGERIAAIVRQRNWRGTVYALSEACAAPFRGLSGVAVETAAAPTEAELIEAVRRDTRERPGCGDERRGGPDPTRPRAARPWLRLVVSNDCPQAAWRLPANDGDNPPPGAA
jgi:uroporphyrinogen-III synthase